jgi:hypothetical protein
MVLKTTLEQPSKIRIFGARALTTFVPCHVWVTRSWRGKSSVYAKVCRTWTAVRDVADEQRAHRYKHVYDMLKLLIVMTLSW